MFRPVSTISCLSPFTLPGRWIAACLAVAVFSSAGYAIDVRTAQDELLTIASNETVDDTLIAVGDSIIVDGTINGDLIAVARNVTIRGVVRGDVITAAQTGQIAGTVEGNIYGFAQTVQIHGPLRNLYAFGQNITIGSGSQSANATLFGQTLSVDGGVGRDLTAFADHMDVRGSVAADIMFFGRRLALIAPAYVGGNLNAHVPSRDSVVVADGATVVGRTNVEIPQPRPSRYATASFYIFQILRLAAALTTGLVLFWVVPALARPHLDGNDLLKAGGLGLLAVVATPVAALIIAITLIGLPLALVLIAVWLLALYLAKIVLAAFLGRSLLSGQDASLPITLLVGLVLVLITINLPFVGGIVNFLSTLVGLGIIMLAVNRWRIATARP